MLSQYPLEAKWELIRSRIEGSSKPAPTGINREKYLDIAEHIVRAAVPWQDTDGTVIDPYYKKEANTCTARFTGAVGQLIKAGRCLDLIDVCVRSFEKCMLLLDKEVQSAPEFWTKELMYAYEALRGKINPALQIRWEETWRTHDPRACYKCIVEKQTHNFLVFAAAGEFFKDLLNLNGDMELVDEAVGRLLEDFTQYGMYRDPNDPITYDLVTKQQLDLICHYGYSGQHIERVRETVRCGALTSLLYQSITGQMPFGGRSNQFHLMEAHFACLCESQAAACNKKGDRLLAGVFKRAAHRAVKIIEPWIMQMEPFRHTKHGFDPATMHGTDSGGYYSVYGLLAASLLGTAYHLADENIGEVTTPAEAGGYVFDLWPPFHKVFAACAGYHLEIDSRADHNKDSTGLGRIHHEGVWPETALSGSITAAIEYNVQGLGRPEKNLAFGPAWKDKVSKKTRLADFETEIEEVSLYIRRETDINLDFDVVYRGDLGGCKAITERYRISREGINYEIILDNASLTPTILIPLIKTDGMEESEIEVLEHGFLVRYRETEYRVISPCPAKAVILPDKPAANRNALYLTGMIETNRVDITLRTGDSVKYPDQVTKSR